MVHFYGYISLVYHSMLVKVPSTSTVSKVSSPQRKGQVAYCFRLIFQLPFLFFEAGHWYRIHYENNPVLLVGRVQFIFQSCGNYSRESFKAD